MENNAGTPNKKLFVGGLPWELRGKDLLDIFGEFGAIEDANVILDRETKRSKGFGFVTFTELDAAVKAQESANGGEINGRAIFVSFAREEERKPRTDRPARY